jgi:uncharacterized protein
MKRKISPLLLGIIIFAVCTGLLIVMFSSLNASGEPTNEQSMLASSISFIIASVVMFKKQKQNPLHSKGLGFLFLGIVVGLIAMTISFFAIYAFGGIDIHNTNFTTKVLRSLLVDLGIFTLVAFGEELFFRGFIIDYLKMKTENIPKTLLISSLIFAIFHMGNPGIFTTPFSLLNIFVIGLFFAIIRLLTKSLWFPIGFHLAWNFSQGDLFGFSVSGEDISSIVTITTKGSTFLSGGDFGAEGSFLTFLLVFILCYFAYLRLKRVNPPAVIMQST